MNIKVDDIIALMETIAPARIAETWDNVGLQIGQRNWPVKSIWIALDPTLPVVKQACKKGADLLISHHPLIFAPLKSIDAGTPIGKIIHLAMHHQMAIFAAHTNLDGAADGLNEELAVRIGLKDRKVLHKQFKLDHMNESILGLGRVGELEKRAKLFDFAEKIKQILQIESVRIVGRPDYKVKRVAVSSGSGSGLVDSFLSSGADVFISGDLNYHNARAVEAAGLALIDIGHFASERIVIDMLAERFQKIFSKNRWDVSIQQSKIEKDPFVVF